MHCDHNSSVNWRFQKPRYLDSEKRYALSFLKMSAVISKAFFWLKYDDTATFSYHELFRRIRIGLVVNHFPENIPGSVNES